MNGGPAQLGYLDAQPGFKIGGSNKYHLWQLRLNEVPVKHINDFYGFFDTKFEVLQVLPDRQLLRSNTLFRVGFDECSTTQVMSGDGK